jgi:hypothetical protein
VRGLNGAIHSLGCNTNRAQDAALPVPPPLS